MALEAAGWKGKGGSALSSSPATAEFAREAVAHAASNAGAVRIDSIDVDGEPIAMLVSFIAGETAFTWKIAYDEAYARFSPGAQLMLEAAEAASSPTRGSRGSIPALRRTIRWSIILWSGRFAIGTMVIGPPGGGLLHRVGLAAAHAETRRPRRSHAASAPSRSRALLVRGRPRRITLPLVVSGISSTNAISRGYSADRKPGADEEADLFSKLGAGRSRPASARRTP